MAQSLFTSRSGGVSSGAFAEFNLATHVGDSPEAVAKNRSLLADRIGIRPERIFYMNQVHGAALSVIDENSDSAFAPSADALFTAERGVALVVLVADCIPLLLSSTSAIAAVHIGRKGLVAGVLASALERFASQGVPVSDMKAELGASICGDCYEVDLATYREVTALHPAAATDEKRHHLDLRAGVLNQLHEAGVRAESSVECTLHSPGYFSYRRDHVAGRQAGVIWL